MLDALFEFSREHCVAICAVMVPANLLITLQTMLFTGFRRPIAQVYLLAAVASCYAIGLLLHVMTWFVVGVVMLPTFILLGLGSLCLLTNGLCVLLAPRWAAQPRSAQISQTASLVGDRWKQPQIG